MITTVPAPRINTNDDRVEIVVWHVERGALVSVGQEIVDVETTKSTVTVAAEAAGYIRPLVEQGSVVPVGDPLYLCASSLEELESAPAASAPAASSPAASSPAASSPAAPLAAQAAGAGASAAAPSGSARANAAARAATRPASPAGYGFTRFTKDAVVLLEERGLSADDFPAAGLLTARALRARLDGPAAPASPGGSSAAPTRPADVPAARASMPIGRPVRTVRMSLAKQAEAESLTQGESGNVTSTLTVAFDSAAIRARLVREQLFDGSLQPLVLYETARLLARFPNLTAWCAEGHVHHYDAVDLGVAFDLGRGLKVVTFRDAATLSALQLFEKTIDVGLRYLDNRLEPDELAGSTFTVTDLSGFDVLHFRPLINGRQSAILGVGGDSAEPGHPMTLSLTFDHRVSNGREAAEFLGGLKARLASYAPLPEPAPPPPAFLPAPSDAAAIRCDRCAIDLPSYYRDFPQDAWMQAYFREDGTLGSVCHRCAGGWS
jgi:pyruvate/2-oxoglutarate dehydrogenase complex dihydrolipoamide acyltransferase (E2) component